jgi:acetamidase/formamidase
LKICILTLLIFTANVVAQSAPANVVKYHATITDVKYVYASAAPVARLKPGDILDTNTLDCFGNAIRKPGDTLSMTKGDNPLTRPFYIEGAEPGDTLAVKILDLEVDGDQGVGAFAPGFGALNETIVSSIAWMSAAGLSPSCQSSAPACTFEQGGTSRNSLKVGA